MSTLARRLARTLNASPARRYESEPEPKPAARAVLPPPPTNAELDARDRRYLACLAEQDRCERTLIGIAG